MNGPVFCSEAFNNLAQYSFSVAVKVTTMQTQLQASLLLLHYNHSKGMFSIQKLMPMHNLKEVFWALDNIQDFLRLSKFLGQYYVSEQACQLFVAANESKFSWISFMLILLLGKSYWIWKLQKVSYTVITIGNTFIGKLRFPAFNAN